MSYTLRTTKSKDSTYLQIYESRYDSDKGYAVNRCVKSLGNIEKLKEQYDDPVAHFRAEVEKMNAEEKTRKATDRERKISEDSPVRHAGYFAVKGVMNTLGVEGYIRIMQSVMDFRYDVFDVMEALVYSRFIRPCSKSATFHDVIPHLLGGEGHGASYDQILSCCEFLGQEYSKVVEIFAEAVRKHYAVDTSCTYFDCTNFYFEIDREDGFRRKGPSKENRKDPIVGLGLLLDANQIPIGMRMYSGNASEKPVLREVIDELRSRSGSRGRVVQVADKGLNCSANIINAVSAGDGYIFSKSVKGLPEKEKLWVLSDEGWLSVQDEAGRTSYRYKSCIDRFPYTYTDKEGHTSQVLLKEKRVLTYNPKLAEKKRMEILKMAEKAKGLCFCQARRSEFGESSKYVRFSSTSGGEDTDDRISVSVDQDAIDRDLALAGYNLIVTSETKMNDEEIYSVYHNLWRIEESFRIMKSSLDARPVFLQKEDCIKGHFLICYISVLLMRILQLHVLKDRFSSGDIMRFISSFDMVKDQGGRYINIARTNDVIRKFSIIFEYPLTNYYQREKELKKLFQKKIKRIDV